MYRRNTTELNLIFAFPDKTGDVIENIRKNYYKHLCQLIFEVVKGFCMPMNILKERMQLSNESIELLKRLEPEQRQMIMVLGHYGNWEWALQACTIYSKRPVFALYAPLKNSWWNNYILKKRSRAGAHLYHTRQIKEVLTRMETQPSMLALVSDQYPSGVPSTEVKFLGLPTGFYNGPEKLSKMLNAVCIYVHLEKRGMGKYMIHLKVLNENPMQSNENEIIQSFSLALEKSIEENPSYWLWSHKRWKGLVPYS